MPPSDAPIYNFQRKERGLQRLSKLLYNRKNPLDRMPIEAFKNLYLDEEDGVEEPATGVASLIPESDISLHGQLGHGSFGVVRRGDWRLPSGKTLPVAIKYLRIQDDQLSLNEAFLREFQAMQSLDHPNLIKLYGLVLSKPVMMVTELAPLGCLLTHLRACSLNRSSSPPIASFLVDALWDMGIQLARGMGYLASKQLVHRDLAARNVLISRVGDGEFPRVKIGDFGLTRATALGSAGPHEAGSEADSSADGLSCYVGQGSQRMPIAWSAPEALERKTFSQASDVWSWAVTLWEIWTSGADPWPMLDSGTLLGRLKAGRRLAWPRLSCPRALYQLMLASWDLEPKRRPHFSYLARRLDQLRPYSAFAKEDFDEADRMGVERNDVIIVMEAPPGHFWWRGQNRRTGEIGSFPSALLDLSQADEACDSSSSNRQQWRYNSITGGGSDGSTHYRSLLDEQSLYGDAASLFNDGGSMNDVAAGAWDDERDERKLLHDDPANTIGGYGSETTTGSSTPSSIHHGPIIDDATYASEMNARLPAPPGPEDDYQVHSVTGQSRRTGGLRDESFARNAPATSWQQRRWNGSSNQTPKNPLINIAESEATLRPTPSSSNGFVSPSAPFFSGYSTLGNEVNVPDDSKPHIEAHEFERSVTANFSHSQYHRNATTGGDVRNPFLANNQPAAAAAAYPHQGSRLSTNPFLFNPDPNISVSTTALSEAAGSHDFFDQMMGVDKTSRFRPVSMEELYLDPLDEKEELSMILQQLPSHLSHPVTVKLKMALFLQDPEAAFGPNCHIPPPVVDYSGMSALARQWRVESVAKLLKLDHLQVVIQKSREDCFEALQQTDWDLERAAEQLTR